jgi:hypothetical protein
MIITSSILKKAHAAVKAMKAEFPEISYRFQLSIEIKRLIAEDREYTKSITSRIKIQRWLRTYVDTTEKYFGTEYEVLSNAIRNDLMIKHFSFPEYCDNWTLAKYLVDRYPINVARWIS